MFQGLSDYDGCQLFHQLLLGFRDIHLFGFHVSQTTQAYKFRSYWGWVNTPFGFKHLPNAEKQKSGSSQWSYLIHFFFFFFARLCLYILRRSCTNTLLMFLTIYFIVFILWFTCYVVIIVSDKKYPERLAFVVILFNEE